MDKNDFTIHFFNLWKNNKLPHFNIFLGPKKDTMTYLEDTIQQFLIEVITREQASSQDQAKELLLKGHADILWVNKTLGKGKDYIGEEFVEMFKFLDFRPLQLSKRYIFIRDAHLLTDNISNKLLKTLEEPNSNAIIIFLAPKDTHFMQTIVSRARIWNINPKRDDLNSYRDYSSFDEYLSSEPTENSDKTSKELISKDLADQLAKYSKSFDEEKLIGNYLDFETNNHLSIKNKINLLQLLKKYHAAKTYNGSNAYILGHLFDTYRSATICATSIDK